MDKWLRVLFVKTLLKVSLLVVLSLSMQSCGKKLVPVGEYYVSYVPNDPLFTDPQYNPECLGESGEPYQERGTYLNDEGAYIPRPGESFSAYRDRLMNTLRVQEAELDNFSHALANKEKSIAGLERQVAQLQAQHVDMRLALARLQTQGPGINRDPLFMFHKVEEGETLQSISNGNYGTYTAWLGIYRFNYDSLSDGPNKILAGETLVLPRFCDEETVRLFQRKAKR